MIYKTFATNIIKDTSKIGFAEKDYSKFKFGASEIGAKFGTDLCISFLNTHIEFIKNFKTIIIYSSPYDYIPTATFSMVNGFFEVFKKEIDKKEVNIRLSKVYRNNTYTVDYGTLSAKERMKLISDDTFDIHDKLDGNELLIFIDDIKITGSHEYVVKKMLDTKNITNSSFFLYHAVLDNLAIDPQYENILNYSYLKGIDQLIQIAKRDDFILNTRFTKYLLSLSSSKFKYFIDEFDEIFLEKLIVNANGNGYNLLNLYKVNLNMLKKILY